MPLAPPAKPRFDRVENALVTAAGYRRLAALSTAEETRRHMLGRAAAWEKRATRYEQEELPLSSALKTARPDPNPCRQLYGPGPAGARCATCALLHATTPGNRTYHKCELRIYTRSVRSDHRLRWPACSRYEAQSE